MSAFERGLNAVDTYTLPARRRITAGVVGAILPYAENQTPEMQRDQIEKINQIGEHLVQGRGMIGILNHWSNGDFLRVLSGQFQYSREIRTVPIVIPIAEHQRHVPALFGVARFNNIHLATIVTEDTKKKEERLKSKGKKVPWEEHKESYGTREYLEHAADALKMGGIALLAPQGARYPKLEPFHKEPVRALLAMANRKHATNIGFFFMNLDIKGRTDYSRVKGYNPFTKYQVTYHNIIGSEELVAEAKKNGRKVDEEVYAIMYRNASEGYVHEVSSKMP